MEIRTKEIAEAAILYMNNIQMISYADKYWVFQGNTEFAKSLRLDLVNKKLKVEPLEFMDAIRRVKAFSNGSEGRG